MKACGTASALFLINGCRSAMGLNQVNMPLSVEEKASPDYVKGVSCPKCIDAIDEEKRARFANRQRQMELAKARGTTHLGTAPKKKTASTA